MFKRLLNEKFVFVFRENQFKNAIFFTLVAAGIVACVNFGAQSILADIEKTHNKVIGGLSQSDIAYAAGESPVPNQIKNYPSLDFSLGLKNLPTQLSASVLNSETSPHKISDNGLSNPNSPIEEISPSPKNDGVFSFSKKSNNSYFLIPTTGINWGELHFNNAVDIANACGVNVLATAEGLVLEAGNHGGYGNYVKIQHPNDTETLYGHLSKILIEKGDYVNRGEIIGLMGNTGNSTGCHLHFEVHNATNPFGK